MKVTLLNYLMILYIILDSQHYLENKKLISYYT